MKKHPTGMILLYVALAGALAGIAGTGFCGEADRQDDEADTRVVLGEEDLAERAEIARNMFRRITPGDEPFVQDVGTWPVAWEEFPSRWAGAATGREYGAWVVPVSVELENGATVIRDADDRELWRGTTDFAKEESASVTLTGGLVSEEEWDGYEAVRDFVENASRQDAEPLPSRGAIYTNGLRFTSVDVDTNGTVEVSLAWEEDGDVDVFAYLIPGTPGTNVVTWTNDENQVITTTNTVWTMAGPNLSGFDNDWEWRGTASVTNGVGVFTDTGAVTNPIIMGFYAAAEANDTDGDGLNDGMERFVHHTDPDNEDTDGDGWMDGEETTAGTNPLDRLDAPRPARGVLIHAVKYSTDTSNQWIQLHCSGPRAVDVGGFRLQAAGTNWETQVVLPEGTWMSPGHFLLFGGEGVTNADVEAEWELAGTISNAPTAGVRLMPPEGATNGPVDVVMYAQNLGFNENGLDTTGWLSQTTNLWASATRHIERWSLGLDTDRGNDWRHVADGVVCHAATIIDSDGDGLTDEQEYTLGYDPLVPDMDDDGLLDGFEAAHGLDPANGDSDGDGTPDGDETDPGTGQSYSNKQRSQGVTVIWNGPAGWAPQNDLRLGGVATFTLTDVQGAAVRGVVLEYGRIPEDYTVEVQGTPFWQLKPVYSPNGRKATLLFAVPDGTNAIQVVVTDASNGSSVTNPAELGADIDGIFEAVRIDLKTVSFGGSHRHLLEKDDGSKTYSAPHWLDNSTPPDGDADDVGDRKYPVCFTRNTKAAVSAEWDLDRAGFPLDIRVKGDGPDNLDFPETLAALSSCSVAVFSVECTNAFPDEVACYPSFPIAWSFSLDKGTNWFPVGASDNPVYVTLGDPLTTTYHTLVHLGCSNAAGETTVAGCTARIWADFTDRDVRRVDGTQLTYYGSWQCQNVTTAELLAEGDGQCGAWANFFIDMRKVQGIDSPDEYVTIRPAPPSGIPQQYARLLCKNWNFAGIGSSGSVVYPYLNLPDTPYLGDAQYFWKFAEVTDAMGMPGQGNPNPASFFQNHQVFIDGEYYDPSYGVKHSSIQDWEDDMIAGYAIGPLSRPVDEPIVGMDLNGDGDSNDLQVDATVFWIRTNPPGSDVWTHVENK